jgi:hypothetical protein
MVLTQKPSSKPSKESTVISNPSPLDDKAKTTSKPSRVVVHCDVGFNNNIFIRGNGADLSWDKGTMLRNTRADEWVWETNQPFRSCEFKVLLNDSQYENGDNHVLTYEDCVEYTPHF